MTAKLVIRMTTTTGYKSESNDNRLKPDITSNIHIHTYKWKCNSLEKVWLRVFGNLGMTKNNKLSTFGVKCVFCSSIVVKIYIIKVGERTWK